MILNTKRIHNFFWRNSPARAKQTPSKVLFVAKKKRSSQLFTSVSTWLVVEIYLAASRPR